MTDKTIPNYKPGGLLKDTFIKRVEPKSAWLLALEAKQRGNIAGVTPIRLVRR